MPRTAGYWKRSRELELIDFIRQREYIWKPVGNTNHHIEQKYKAYAEFAAKLGRGFTARSVRDRWVNIRTTFNHNLKRLERSRKDANNPSGVYVPTWPLWEALQFLRTAKNDNGFETYHTSSEPQLKEESHPKLEVSIRQRPEPDFTICRKKVKPKSTECIRVLDDLIEAMKPLVNNSFSDRKYWFFGKHVVERLNTMREIDAECARRKILALLAEWDRTCEINCLKVENLKGA